jgi:sugar lactone lactonase YvrE
MGEFSTLIGGLSFTECPRWRGDRLYVTDRYTRRVLVLTEDGTAETFARTSGLPAGIGFLPDGRLLIASMLDRKILRREHDGSFVEHADLSAFAPWPINDMLVDDEGRAWVGQFGFDLFGGAPACATSLLCVLPDGSAKVVADQLGFPNGMVLTPDRRTLIVAETTMNRLSAFTVTGDGLSERRTWAAFGEPSRSTAVREIAQQSAVMPDGICLDAKGAAWVADVTHQRLIRVIEGGTIVDERKTDGVSVFACMLGGHDGRTLFACAAPTFDDAEASANHRSSILMTRVEVPHAGLP